MKKALSLILMLAMVFSALVPSMVLAAGEIEAFGESENFQKEIDVNANALLTDGKTGFSGNWGEVGTGDVLLIGNDECQSNAMDVTLLYNLGGSKTINSLALDFYHCAGVMIGYPEGKILVEVSADGETYTSVGSYDLAAADVAIGNYGTVTTLCEFDAVEAAYVKATFTVGSSVPVLGENPADGKIFWEFASLAEVSVGVVAEPEYFDKVINVGDNALLTDGKTGFSGNWGEVGTGDVLLIGNDECQSNAMKAVLVYDLGETKSVDSLSLDFYHCAGVMIGYPEGQILVEVSTDGETYTTVGSFDIADAEVVIGGYGTVTTTCAFDAVDAAYIKATFIVGSSVPVLGENPADGKIFWEFASLAEVSYTEVIPVEIPEGALKIDVSHVNAYSWGAYNEMIIYGEGENSTSKIGQGCQWWLAFKVENIDGVYTVTEIEGNGETKDMVAPADGFLLYCYSNDAASYEAASKIGVGTTLYHANFDWTADVASATAIGQLYFIPKSYGENVAIGKPVQNADKRPSYNSDLTDGVALGNLTYNAADWFGFYWNPGMDLEGNLAQSTNAIDGFANPIVDLGGFYEITTVRVNLFTGNTSGICAPETVTLKVSADGETFETIEVVSFDWPEEGSSKVEWVEFTLPEGVVAQYVCLEMVMRTTFVFLNEIEVYGTEAEAPAHEHNLVHVEAVAPGCHYEGNIEHWYCTGCETVWSDEALTQVTNHKSVILPATGEGLLVEMEATEPGCHYDGNTAYWICYMCEQVWADEALTQLTNIKNVVRPALGGEVVHAEAKEATYTEYGNIEHWYCEECGQVWQDEALTQLTNRFNVIIPMLIQSIEVNVNDLPILTDGKTGFAGNWGEVGTGDVHLVSNPMCKETGMEVVILYNLGETKNINSFALHLYHCAGVMIGYPESAIILEVSVDGENYETVGYYDLTAADVAIGSYGTVVTTCEFDAIEAAYVRATVYVGSSTDVLGETPADNKIFWEFISIAEVEVGEVPEHNIVHVEAVAPGCHYTGNIEHWYCTECETVWSDEALTQITNHKSVILPELGGEVIHVEAKAPSCDAEGNIEYWYCEECEQVWQDEARTQLTNFKNVLIGVLDHTIVHMEAVAPGCHYTGNNEHWYCSVCNTVWADEALTQITNHLNVIVPALGGEVVHVEAVAPTYTANGNIEYWYCEECEQVWQDEALTQLTNFKNVILPMLELDIPEGALKIDISHVNAYTWGAYNEMIIYGEGTNSMSIGYDCTWWLALKVENIDGVYTVTEIEGNGETKDMVAPADGFLLYCYSNDAASYEAASKLSVGATLAVATIDWTQGVVASETAVGQLYFMPKNYGENVAIGKPVQNADKRPSYNAELTDGVALGNLTYNAADWFGFYWNPGMDLEGNLAQNTNAIDGFANPIVDLGGLFNITTVRVNLFTGNTSGICAPETVTLKVSADGETFETIEVVSFNWPEEGSNKVEWVEFTLPEGVTAQYVCLELVMRTTFVFLNEIEVYGTEAHVHNLVHVEAVAPGCHYTGNIEHWYCLDCETVWADEALTQVTNHMSVILPELGGEVIHVEAVAPTCDELGNIEYWYCEECGQVWQDEARTQLTNRMNVILPALEHDYQDGVCTNCGDAADVSISLNVNSEDIFPGAIIDVEVLLLANPGFAHLSLDVLYDTDLFELVSVSNGDLFENFAYGAHYVWSSAYNVAETGVLVTLTLKVKDDIAAGSYNIEVAVNELWSEDETEVAISDVTGTVITIAETVYGDANGDGEVNGKDVVRLLQYLANYNKATGTSTKTVAPGADANGDGVINGKDATRLLRYLASKEAGEESSVVLGPNA